MKIAAIVTEINWIDGSMPNRAKISITLSSMIFSPDKRATLSDGSLMLYALKK
jgi:hypothetical protein